MLNLTENQKNWVAALRSGKFNQTSGTLEDLDGHCCLGVGCRIAPQELVNELDGWLRGDNLEQQFKVQEWLGLRTEDGDNVNPEIDSLVTLNDDKFKSFAEIADILETVPGYFVDNPTV